MIAVRARIVTARNQERYEEHGGRKHKRIASVSVHAPKEREAGREHCLSSARLPLPSPCRILGAQEPACPLHGSQLLVQQVLRSSVCDPSQNTDNSQQNSRVGVYSTCEMAHTGSSCASQTSSVKISGLCAASLDRSYAKVDPQEHSSRATAVNTFFKY